jgi:uncharacterized protein
MFRVLNQESRVVAERVEAARSLWARLKGLLGRSHVDAGSGLWIEPCRSIHTFFMRFPIDAAFLSEEGEVLRLYETLPPYRLTRVVPRARVVLELPAGALRSANVSVGDRLRPEGRP